jgi:hypothetical protein
MARRDAKRMTLVASDAMTEREYLDAICIEHLFGHIQIRSKMRSLAAEYGLPDDCVLPPQPAPQPRRSLWTEEMSKASDRAAVAQLRVDHHFALSLPRPGDPVTLTTVMSVT